MNAVRWGPSGRMFASGGSDRKLKLWEVRGGMSIKTSSLPGLHHHHRCDGLLLF